MTDEKRRTTAEDALQFAGQLAIAAQKVIESSLENVGPNIQQLRKRLDAYNRIIWKMTDEKVEAERLKRDQG